MPQLDPGPTAAIIGAALAVVSILLTMLWTIREMYAHESRIAGVGMIEAVAAWKLAKSDLERQVALARAREWLRFCEEFIDHAGRRSRPALLLMLTALTLFAALVVVALNKSFSNWDLIALILSAVAAATFALAALAVYNVHGYFRVPPLQAGIRLSTNLVGLFFPFLKVPHPRRWSEVQRLIDEIPELKDYERNVYRPQVVTDAILAAQPAESVRDAFISWLRRQLPN